MRWIRPLPRALTRPVSIAVLISWAVVMAVLVNRSYLQASATLGADLARYGSDARWRGIYYRGEKIGFTVGQTLPSDDGGYELEEDGQLQMTLLGQSSFARLRTTARVDTSFALRSFEFLLDPGTGPVVVRGASEGRRVTLHITTQSGTSTQQLELDEPPILGLNLSRRLANGMLIPGARHDITVFDPATLRNAPAVVRVGPRELVRTGVGTLPAFRVEMEFSGLKTVSWMTDTGEVVREESPMGLISVRETAERATSMAVSGEIRNDLLEASAVVPKTDERIDDPRDVLRLRLRVDGADLSGADLHGAGQTVSGNIVEIADARALKPMPREADVARYLQAEPFVESDDPAIRAEVERALANIGARATARERAEALTRYVNALLDKKPTVSLPSAREVLRTKIGDCNEHTALYVAMARAAGIPARIAVGLTFTRGAFYYHAWPEVYLSEGAGGLWMPVDPTLNQFPADATHLRLARGGLAEQAKVVPLVGRLQITILELELSQGARPILVGGQLPPDALPAVALPIPQRGSCDCWCGATRRR